MSHRPEDVQQDASKRLSVEECLAHPWVPCSEEDGPKLSFLTSWAPVDRSSIIFLEWPSRGCTIDWDNLPEDEFEYDPLGSFP